MLKKKAPLAISLLLLGSAILLLAGCSWKNEAVSVDDDEKTSDLSLDKLQRDDTDQKMEADATAKKNVGVPPKPTPQPVIQEPSNPMGKQYPTPPAMTIDATKRYIATLHTEKGDIEIALAASVTPKTVNNFVFLARDHFYDGVVFHRTIPGFMIQGGDPTGTGMGGPGYKFDDESFTGEYKKGTVAMANAGPNTNGSQFFIMQADRALSPDYVIFGQVTKGLDVVDTIAIAPTQPGGEGSKPVMPVKITSVDITEGTN